jgi:hypothetical protein
VYIDDGSAGDDGELRIDVDGHDYTEQENFSYANNGVDDSVMVDAADGGHLIYTDTGHTGSADLVTEVDERGDVVEQAHFDPHSGQWVDDGSGQPTAGDGTDAAGPAGSAGEQIVVETAAGRQNVGDATVASGGGAPDTAVVTDGQGDTVLYTDTNHDGVADQAVEISADGHVVVADDSGDGHWVDVQQGHLDGSGQIVIDGKDGGGWTPPADVTPESGTGGGQPPAGGATHVAETSDAAWGASRHGAGDSSAGVVRIDSMTGQWISPN